jgi:ABC-type transporter Mla subunit MlaD
MSVGIGGLVPGSAVQVGGLEVGAVAEVRPVLDDGVFSEELDVVIAVDDRVRFRDGAEALLQKPLVGGLSSINFASLGDPNASELDEGDVMPGRISPPELLASAGYGESQALALRQLIDAAARGAGNFEAISQDIRDSLVPRANTVVERVERDYPLWAEDVTATLDNVNTAAERAPDIAEKVEATIDTISENTGRATDAIVSNGEAFESTLAELTAFLDDLAASRQSAESFLRQLDEEIAPQASAFLEDADDALTDAGDALERANSALAEQEPNVRQTLANLRIASQEVRYLTAEVRRSPWRLIYRPDQRELEYELLYDAARSYAAAVTNLRAATESLEATLATDRLPDDADRLAELKANVESAFASFERAQVRFMTELMDAGATADD